MIIAYNIDKNEISLNKKSILNQKFENFKKNLSLLKIINLILFSKKVEIKSSFSNQIILEDKLSFIKIFFFIIISKNSIYLNNKIYKIKYSYIFNNLFQYLISLIIVNTKVFKNILIYLLKIISKKKKLQIKKKNKIILFVFDISKPKFNSGGVVAHTLGSIDFFLKKFDKTTIFTNLDIHINPNQKLEIIKLNTNFKVINYSFYDYLKFNFLIYRNITKFYSNILKDSDLIYSRYRKFFFINNLLSKKYNIPLIYEFNGSEVWVDKFWNKLKVDNIDQKFEDEILKNGEYRVCVSRPLKKIADNKYKKNNILIENGVNFKKISNIKGNFKNIKNNLSNNKIKIAFSGTFGLWHGCEVLAKAYLYLYQINKIHDLELIFIGSGITLEDTKKILKPIKNLSYKFYGMVDFDTNIKILKNCDILVSPQINNQDNSIFFGSPTKIFEYMAIGKKILVSDCGDLPKYIFKNYNGFLFRSGDHLDLAKKILYLKSTFIKNISYNSKLTAKNKFDWNKRYQKMYNIIYKK